MIAAKVDSIDSIISVYSAVDKFTVIAKPYASLKCDDTYEPPTRNITASLVPQLPPHSSAGTLGHIYVTL